MHGEHQRAAELHQESLAIFHSLGCRHFGLPWADHSLGETERGLGKLAEALAQGLTIRQRLGDQASIAWCLAGLGSAAALNEAAERAAESLRQRIGCRPAPAARAAYERAMTLGQAIVEDLMKPNTL